MFFRAFVTAFAAAFTQTLAVLIDNVIVCACYGETEIAAASAEAPGTPRTGIPFSRQKRTMT